MQQSITEPLNAVRYQSETSYINLMLSKQTVRSYTNHSYTIPSDNNAYLFLKYKFKS